MKPLACFFMLAVLVACCNATFLPGYNYGAYNYAALTGGYNPYNPYACNPLADCLLKKLKPCLWKKALLAKYIYKKNLLANKLICGCSCL